MKEKNYWLGFWDWFGSTLAVVFAVAVGISVGLEISETQGWGVVMEFLLVIMSIVVFVSFAIRGTRSYTPNKEEEESE